MGKQAVYFFPGLGASTKIFEYIQLPEEHYEIILLEWKIPITEKEPLKDYVKKIIKEITHETPILVGVSFGGIIVQEISKQIATKKVVIISSIKSHLELPTRLKVIRDTKAYKLFPAKLTENIEEYEAFFIGDYLKKRADLYKMYFSVRSTKYMKWAIYNVLHWQQEKADKNLVHIHGTEDNVFPIKHVENCIKIEGGDHAMILTKAKSISRILVDQLNN